MYKLTVYTLLNGKIYHIRNALGSCKPLLIIMIRFWSLKIGIKYPIEKRDKEFKYIIRYIGFCCSIMSSLKTESLKTQIYPKWKKSCIYWMDQENNPGNMVAKTYLYLRIIECSKNFSWTV
jgi:hypothetical protein